MAMPQALLDGVIAMFDVLVEEGQSLRKRWQDATKSSGTSFMDAVKASDDPDVKTWQERIDAIHKEANELRESQKARLVETGKISGAAASVDRFKSEFQTARMKVKTQLDAFVKGGIIEDAELLRQLQDKAESVLGKPRGRAAGSDEDDSDDTDTATE